ncbi:hypothetical protein INP57_01920 [Saccharopolyspora sp. HNM0986]|uniref:hypothetical protein n=1 Tax=Saccharopolyspora galaxeae TaxID=2781241 RepID=UPI00190C25B9|nr:hypothetical protein [Saccharopolyspora sp. HNM0986]MBK0865555.1 hypothetical protein [Saccharopolyspora sp. HNM0986]
MEVWRIVATALTIAFGALLILDAVVGIRGTRAQRRPKRARAAVQGGLLLVVSTGLVATVLPATLVWALLAATALIISIRFVID